ncbi:exodeoxyribonuclease VII small subunit [Thiolapillus sp.]
MSRKKPENLSFEEALSELETLVDHLEQGEISLEDSLKSFERGVALTRSCQQALSEAEQKVRILNEKTLDAETEAFDADAPD